MNHNLAPMQMIKNYITLSLHRVMYSDDHSEQLKHFAAIKYVNNQPVDYLDIFVGNDIKRYDANNNVIANDFLATLKQIHKWIGSSTLILHESSRNDMDGLHNKIKTYLHYDLVNQYIDLEKLVIDYLKLTKTSLKNVALHYGVYRPNVGNNMSKGLHQCFLIHEVWQQFKKEDLPALF